MWRNRFARGFGSVVWQITDDDDILSVFFSSKRSLFYNSNAFGSYIIHILYTGCAKIKKKNNSGAKSLSKVETFMGTLFYDLYSFLNYLLRTKKQLLK